MITEFKTVAAEGAGLFKDRGSKFLAFAYPVQSEEDIKSNLEDLRKQYFDARHHCYAYVIGNDGKVFRANDDGEPNHSAGDPILGQIHSKELTNTLVVVIRYFGGTKLGVSGLINAYKTAAELALNEAGIKTVEIKQSFKIIYSYEATNEIMRLTNDLSVDIVEQLFEEDCLLIGKIKIDLVETIVSKVQLLKDLGNNVDLKIL
jgi:uncharacterized YigZ family protein